MAARHGHNSEARYLEGLNPEQRLAVETTEGAVLVLAGAGTGKTRVLTTRIAHILSLGLAFPSQILAVTFTNKAAREMKQRVGLLVGEAIEGMPWLGTFHSIGVKLLRRHAELAGLKSSFTILDTDDQVRLLRQIIQAEGLDDKRWAPRTFAQMIDGWKNKGLGPAEIPEGDARSFANGKGRALYSAYQDRLATLNACDFGDLLMHPIRIFRAASRRAQGISPQVQIHTGRRVPGHQHRAVHVAEAAGAAARGWARQAHGRQSPPCGGDGAERPKAAEPDRASDAVRTAPAAGQPPSRGEWPVSESHQSTSAASATTTSRSMAGAAPRSTTSCASKRISRAPPSSGSSETTARPPISSAPPRISSPIMRAGSARRCSPIASTRRMPRSSSTPPGIRKKRRAPSARKSSSAQRNGHLLNDMAILVRASFQMREFEDRFVTLGLNYRVIGGPRFYERQEIRDALAYLRVVAQGADDLAFERIVNVPKRGLGESAIRQIHDTSRALRVPMLEAAGKLAESDELKPKPRAALREVAANFARWQGMIETKPHTELAEIILEESGYTEMWKNDRSAEAPGRLENLKELIRSMEEYESLRSFLEHVALVMDAEQNEQLDAVNIMTLHSAKGLEFETVFLPGWEEGLFPHQRALDEGGRSGLEEERRLAYVGLTRAKRHLHLWFVSNRRIHGLWQSTIPSRFLDELPEAHVEVADAGNSYGGYGAGRYGGGGFASAARQRTLMAPRASTRPSRSPTPTPRPAGSARSKTAPRRRATIGARAPATRSSASAMAKPIPATAPAAPASRAASSTASWSPNRWPTAPRRSMSATACSTRNSATAMSRRSKATSSPSTSTAPARRRCWTGFVTGL